ncbi:MAG: divalent-cation tolerance protein CutA [Pirellulaceae bacterium]
MPDDYYQILTTTATREESAKIAEALIDKQLAACVQIDGPIESIYRWRGAIQREQEWRLRIKTTSDCREAAKRLVFEMHPYEQPQWIVVRIDQLDDGYQRWIDEQTRMQAET